MPPEGLGGDVPGPDDMLRLALYQPDIPQNTGTILRLAACLGVPVDIIEPCGFPWSLASLRRAGMDYIEHADIARHVDWAAFRAASSGRRLVLLTTKAATPYWQHRFDGAETLLLGRESHGVPDDVHKAVEEHLLIPLRAETRSLNIALAAAMVLGEALRQLDAFPARP
jgi:tRNA (cytidine/uridine-2'-O-)-methyltransferase